MAWPFGARRDSLTSKLRRIYLIVHECGLAAFWRASLLSSQHNQNKTPNDGYLGSRNDEERSEMRYAVRIAEFSESSEL